MTQENNLKDYEKAGQIAKGVKAYAKTIIKKDMLLYDIAEKIESKIIELGGKLAFPVNLCINEIAAHSTPLYEDSEKSHGLLKVDFGAHVNGFISDCAFSIDLEDSEENKKIIEASEKALESALSVIKENVELKEIGAIVSKTITSYNLSPIRNLSGHSLGEYEIHSGVTIPNYDNGSEQVLEKGFYAVEPFATPGGGVVYDGGDSGIYLLQNIKPLRDDFSRQVFSYIKDEYHTLPFCSRWLVKKFGKKVLFTLKTLETQGVLKQYSKLIEKSREKVSQTETTIYFDGKKVVDLINGN
jgi:methionyl aminopeptidase